MSEGLGELKWACPLCSDTGNFVFNIRIKKDTVMRVCQFFVISY